MRVQVQWGTGSGGPTFSRPVATEHEDGVTVFELWTLFETVLDVRPADARDSCMGAAYSQLKWILSRHPEGVTTGGYSYSKSFAYKAFTDARVDIENIRGHNLRRLA